MSIFDFDHSAGGQPLSIINIQSIICLLLAGIFNEVQELTADTFYQWFFRVLSVVSLVLVIYINWNKARDYWRKN